VNRENKKFVQKCIRSARQVRAISVSITLCFLIFPWCVIADSYLDLIEEAAGNIELDPENKAKSLGLKKEEPSVNPTRDFPLGMLYSDFETSLRQRYIGSFAFYNKLDKSRKMKVYEAYQSKPKIEYIRELIKDYYLGG